MKIIHMSNYLGIESTSHTYGIGIIEQLPAGVKILANETDMYKPEKGGIHPIEARNHHMKVRDTVLDNALKKSGLSLDQLDFVCFSQGPGLPPCLKVGLEHAKELSRKLKKPLIGVNHAVAHIEIGKFITKCKDPVIVYISGGNTQIIIETKNKYKICGETLDISLGNAGDVVARELGYSYPGSYYMEKEHGNYIELPYVVKGMDVSFSGIATEAVKKYKSGTKKQDIAYSFFENVFCMITEVTERALSHTGKKQVLLIGGVASSPILQKKMKIMCSDREAECFTIPREYASDNGAMIAVAGIKYKNILNPDEADFMQKCRVDDLSQV